MAGIEEFVAQAAGTGLRIDEVERELFGRLLTLRRTLCEAFVAAQGDGDARDELETADGRRVRRLSIIGELSIFGAGLMPNGRRAAYLGRLVGGSFRKIRNATIA